ncbi:MAG: hypothetical protein ACK4F6_12785 [Hylemonella sp.]
MTEEIRRCEAADATAAALAMAFISMDTMTFLSLPDGVEAQGRTDFINWVDTYLKGHPDQPYKYRGIDVYGARCAMLHSFGSATQFHDRNGEALVFGYHDGGQHMHNPEVDPRLVMIGSTSFLNDVVAALAAFMEACKSSPELKARVEPRLERVLAVVPLRTVGTVGTAAKGISLFGMKI